jgi:hypothetical protein
MTKECAMRCALIVREGGEPDLATWDRVIEAMVGAGVLLVAERLQPLRGLDPVPVAAFVLLHVDDLPEARLWARRLVGPTPGAVVEVRPVRDAFSREFEAERILAVA